MYSVQPMNNLLKNIFKDALLQVTDDVNLDCRLKTSAIWLPKINIPP